jgi:hypothetical protein
MSNPIWLPVLSALCSSEFYKRVRDPRLAKAVLEKYGLNEATSGLLLAISDSKGSRFLLNHVVGVDWPLPVGVGPKVICGWLDSYTGRDADITLAGGWPLGHQIAMLSDSQNLDKIRSLNLKNLLPLCGPEAEIDRALGAGFQQLVPHLQKSKVGRTVIREYALQVIEHEDPMVIEDKWVLDWAASPRCNLSPRQEEFITQSRCHLIPNCAKVLWLLGKKISAKLTVALIENITCDDKVSDREKFLFYRGIIESRHYSTLLLLANTTRLWTSSHQRLALASVLRDPSLLCTQTFVAEFDQEQIAEWLSYAPDEMLCLANQARELALGRIFISRLLEANLSTKNWEMVAKIVRLPNEPYVFIDSTDQIDYLAANHLEWCERQWFYIPPSVEYLSSLHKYGLLYRVVIPGPGTYRNVGMIFDWLLLNLSEKKCDEISMQVIAMARFVAKDNCGQDQAPLEPILYF